MMRTSSHYDLSSTHGYLKHLLANLIAFVALLIVTAQMSSAQTGDKVLANVGGETITQEQVDSQIITQLLPLQQQIYALRNAALQNLIARKVLEDEAKRRGLTAEQLKRKMMSGEVSVSPEQVEKVYQQNVTAFGMMSKDEVIEKLRMDLEAQERIKRYREQIAKLKQLTQVQVFLDEPRLQLASPVASFASLGAPNARIVLTEFSDFQCPYCKAAQSVLHQLLKAFPSDIKLEFRNFPLEMHPFALTAARGSYCAGKQNRFWDYHDALFSMNALDSNSVNKVANDLGLDNGQFRSCLSSDDSQHSVAAEVNEALALGINSTPTLLINGRKYRGSMEFDDLKDQIEHELKTLVTLAPQPRPLTAKERKK